MVLCVPEEQHSRSLYSMLAEQVRYYTTFYTLHLLYTAYFMYYTLYIIHNVLYTTYHTLRILHIIFPLCILNFILYTTYYTLYIMHYISYTRTHNIRARRTLRATLIAGRVSSYRPRPQTGTPPPWTSRSTWTFPPPYCRSPACGRGRALPQLATAGRALMV